MDQVKEKGSTRAAPMRKDAEPDDTAMEFTKVTISMPVTMHAELRRRARARGISVTELMRRAVALDALVFDPSNPQQEVILRDKVTDSERVLQLL